MATHAARLQMVARETMVWVWGIDGADKEGMVAIVYGDRAPAIDAVELKR